MMWHRLKQPWMTKCQQCVKNKTEQLRCWKAFRIFSFDVETAPGAQILIICLHDFAWVICAWHFLHVHSEHIFFASNKYGPYIMSQPLLFISAIFLFEPTHGKINGWRNLAAFATWRFFLQCRYRIHFALPRKTLQQHKFVRSQSMSAHARLRNACNENASWIIRRLSYFIFFSGGLPL